MLGVPFIGSDKVPGHGAAVLGADGQLGLRRPMASLAGARAGQRSQREAAKLPLCRPTLCNVARLTVKQWPEPRLSWE